MEPNSDILITAGDFFRLKRWNTPTIFNGWEQVTSRNPAKDGINLEETLRRIDQSIGEFHKNMQGKFNTGGEW